GAIELRLQPQKKQILQGLLASEERFDLTLCNPPFHASLAEATRGSSRKWRNLGKQDPSRKLPVLNFGGQAAELWCEGGEAAFVRQLVEESRLVAHQVLWFSTLVSKASNLPGLLAAVSKAGAQAVRTVDMAQGQKQSRFVAWTFLDSTQQGAWARARWGAPGAQRAEPTTGL
ncbi:MAG: RlmF-related methyltransferase, partial [Pseudomonas sp.]|uniref:RlmF-related methyltransferase n=1 Tax=Pseudomonas sp. TaxID=306 RepID=UPI0033942791